MWLTNYIAKKNKAKASQGEVGLSSTANANISGASKYNNSRIVVPFGIAYNPPVGEKGVILPLDNRNLMVGVYSRTDKDLQPGEIMLFSSGGAEIVLKNSGDVVINGKVI